MNYDLIILGAGPGGYVAAIRASQLGLKVAVIEKEHLGGICANFGCIPTKALLKCAEVYKTSQHASDFGVKIEKTSVNLIEMVQYSRNVVKKLTTGISGLMKKSKVDVINGFGRLIDKNTIEIEANDGKKSKISGKYIILATGAKPRILSGYEISERIWTYKEAMTPDFMPKKLLVVGSGAIGSEFAYFYNSIGVKVILLEVADRILPAEDFEISNFVRKSFEKDGMTIYISAKLHSTKESKTNVAVDFEVNGKREKEQFDAVIMAVGVVPNTDGLDKIVKLDDRKLVQIDKFCQTSVENIYAIGDIVQGPWLAHKASHEGVIAVEKIAEKMGKYKGKIHPIIRENIPGCTYCHPQIASIGLTEENAKKLGKELKIGRFPLLANGKSVALNDTNGFIKIIFEAKTGEILGCHMVGPEVTEMIQGIAIAKQAELVEEDLIHTIFPHPTVSESIHEAVLNGLGIGLHF